MPEEKMKRYAVGVPLAECEGEMLIIQTYPTPEKLEEGFAYWKNFAEGRGITLPMRIEFQTDGGCIILA